MNPHRARAARLLADAVPVTIAATPRAAAPWRATAVLEHPDGHTTRVTAPGFTRSGAERRARRAVLRELLRGWWS